MTRTGCIRATASLIPVALVLGCAGPPPCASTTVTTVTTPSATLPMELWNGRAVIPVQINGRSFPMVLSTASRNDFLSVDVADLLRLKSFPSMILTDPAHTGTALGVPIAATDVQIGGLRPYPIAQPPSYGPPAFPFVPLPASTDPGAPKGIVGRDLLPFDLDIDPAAKTAMLYDARGCTRHKLPPADVAYEVSTAPFESWTEYRIPRVNIRINGVEAAAVIDTGSPRTSVSASMARQLGADLGTATGQWTASPYPVQFRSLAIGRDTMASPTLLVDPTSQPRTAVVLGTDILFRYHLRISWNPFFRVSLAPLTTVPPTDAAGPAASSDDLAR